MFYLKHKGEEKWIAGGARALVPNMAAFEHYQHMCAGLTDTEAFTALKATFEQLSHQGIVGHANNKHLVLDFSKKSTTKMKDVLMFECDPVETIKAQLKFIEVLETKFTELNALSAALQASEFKTVLDKEVFEAFDLRNERSYALGTYRSYILQAKGLLEKILKNISKFEVVERNAQNSYIQKKAWAIFADNGHTVGFKNKDGDLGDISSARLFDSDKGALRTASSMRLENFEIAEVEVTLKKRTNLKPEFQNKQFLEALSTIERDKIDNFINEIGAEKVEAVLKKRVNKL